MKDILYRLYRVTLMEYFEKEKYWDMFCDECDKIIENER